MIKKEELEVLGSTNLVKWMREAMGRVEKDYKKWFDKDTSVFHIRTDSLENFKRSMEEFAKNHPDDDIKASGFVIATRSKL